MSQPPPSTYASDEVSLRDVFLVLLRGLPIILGLALVFGGVAYFLNARQQPTYNAQSTVMVTPPAIAIAGDDTLTFRPPNEVSFQSYSALARSQEVLQNAVAKISGAEITPTQLLSLSSLREVVVAAPTGDTPPPLSVVHTVRNANPERAAQLADAWAESTLTAVRRSLFASLELVGSQTAEEAARLQKNVEAVEGQVEAFAAQDEGTLLEAELDGRARQLTDGRARLSELRTEIAASRARIAALQSQGAATEPTSGTSSSSPEAFWVLSAAQALDNAEGGLRPSFAASSTLTLGAPTTLADAPTLADLPDDLQDALIDFADTLTQETLTRVAGDLARYEAANRAEARAGAQRVFDLALLGYAQAQTTQEGSASGDTLDLLRQAELQREQVRLEGLLAEAQGLEDQLPTYTEDVSGLQRQIAALDQQRDRLNRELMKALDSYDTVTQLQSSVSYLTNLAPTNARILSQASVPTSPVGPRSTFNTVVATVIGGVLGLVFVFLSAAIRRPASRSRPTAA